MKYFTAIIGAVTAMPASAHDGCIEPYRPDTELMVQAGYGTQELREEFRIYFSEVENYLNCLNSTAARVRKESTAATQDYNRVLDQYPSTNILPIEEHSHPSVELKDGGKLYLDADAGWLK